MRTFLAAGILLAGAAFTATAPGVRADDWTKTYAISGRADLHVQTDDGDVTITSADQKDIYARVTTALQLGILGTRRFHSGRVAGPAGTKSRSEYG